MRKLVILFKTKASTKYLDAKRGHRNLSTFRGTWRKPMYTDKLNAHAIAGIHLFILYTFFPPPSFLNVFRINSKRYYLNP